MSCFTDRVRAMKGISTLPPVHVLPAINTPIVEADATDAYALAAQYVGMAGGQEDQYLIGPPRASSIQKACMRMHCIGATLRLKKREWSSLKMNLTFGIGNAIHYWMQNDPTIFGNRRVGWWQCRNCDTVEHFGHPPHGLSCSKCGCSGIKIFEYYEHALRSTHPSVTGHPDLFLERNPGLVRVVEIKTINGEDFLKLRAPLADHEWQISTYMWGCARDKSLPVQVDDKVGYVLYVSKKHMGKDNFPMKMYAVKKNESRLQRILAKAHDFDRGMVDFPKNLPEPISKCVDRDFMGWISKECPCKRDCMRYFGV